MPRQLIHRDPHPDNILFKEGRLAGFIDFELSERNVRIFDPCYASTAILNNNYDDPSVDNNRWFSVYRELLSGYDEIARLSELERRAAPNVVLCIQFICIAYFSGIEKFSALAKTNIDMLHWLVANREKLRLD